MFSVGSLGQSQDLTVKIDSAVTAISQTSALDKKQGYRDLNLFIVRQGGSKSGELYEYLLKKDTTELGQMMILFGYSKIISRVGDTEGSLKIKLKGLQLAEKLEDAAEIVEYNISIANSYLFQNKPDKALYYLNIAEPIIDKHELKRSRTNLYYNRAMLQKMLGNDKGAKDYYLKVYENVKNDENSPRKRFALYIVVDFFSQSNYPVELATYTEILAELYENAHPDTPLGHMPIKEVFKKKNAPEHISLYQQAFKISDSLNQINSYVLSASGLSEIYLSQNRPKKAIEILTEVVEKIKNLGKPHYLKEVYSKLVESHIKDDDYVGAYHYKLLEGKLNDSITSEKVQRNVAELEIKYDSAKKEKELAEQSLTIEKRTRQKNQILIGLVALGLVTIVLLLFFRKRIRDQKVISKQKASLQENKILELKQQNKLLALQSMIEGQETERFRIAQDLHDSLGGLLSTVKAHFTTIQNEIAQLEKLNLTGKTNDLIDEACLEVRRISHNMMPQSLSILGLEGALDDAVENLKEQGYSVTLEINNLPKLETTKEVVIYRLVQEIFTNIIKHAEAKSILVQLIGHQNEINLLVEDDGKGFDYNTSDTKGGYGLKNIKSRVEFLNGTINWDSELQKGTTININIPTP